MHHRAKLTNEQVRAMRRQYDKWQHDGERKGYEALARIFGCGISTARDIVTYRTRYNA